MAAAKSRRRIGRIAFAFVAAALLLLILLWDWNWFRPTIERQASNALGRQVTIGNFDVDLGLHPTIALDRIAVANPPEFPEDTRLGRVEHFAVTVDPWQYFHGRIALLNIDIVQPWGDLKPGPSGKPNYRFEKLEQSADQEPQPEAGKSQGPELVIGRLNVEDGDVHILEPRFKTDFRLRIHTRNNADGQPRIHVDAEGTYSGQPVTGRFVGGSLLSLREPGTRYPVELRVKNGATEAVLIGTVDDPLKLRGANLKLDFRGDNLADLYPLTGVPLQPSPPFSLNGTFDYRENKFRFDDFIGKVGGSDLGGDVAVDPAGPHKRLITMRLQSRKVALADLSGFLGADGGKGTGSDDTAQQNDEPKQGDDAAGGKVLPDKPFSVPRLQAVNMDVTYKVARIESDKVPVDNLDAHLIVDEGRVKLEPLNLAVGNGTIAIKLNLDTNQQPIHTVADVDFRELDFGHIMNKTSAFKGSGKVGGSARLDAHGNSVAQMLASGDGEMKLFMAGGDVSALLVDLAGLDFGNSLLSALGIPSRAQLRCFVSDFVLQDGLVDTRILLADTTEANLVGDGTVNLRDETIDYELSTQPKSLSAAALSAPIGIGGTLGAPRIMPNLTVLGAKGGAAVVLGAVMGPLAALIPTIQLGLGHNNDCEKLLREAGTPSAAKPPSARDDAAAGKAQSQ